VRQTGASAADTLRAVISGEELAALQDAVAQVRVEDALVDYMLQVVERTRTHESLAMGVSPRGAQALYRATQGLAAVEGREYATPDDVKRLVVPVFAHRVAVNSRVALAHRGSLGGSGGASSGEAAERVLQEILTLVDVPL
jgi:MoxR-like ATPase